MVQSLVQSISLVRIPPKLDTCYPCTYWVYYVVLVFAPLGADIRLVIIIFNHLAPHCNTIRVKTRDRISDRYVLERCRLMVDAVFWEGKMSNCKVNDELIIELKAVLKPN